MTMASFISKSLTSFAAALLGLASALPMIASAQWDSEDEVSLFAGRLETGRWGPRDGSRTGLFLETQNGRTAGILAVYNEFGEPRWFNFSGANELVDDPPSRPPPRILARLWEFSGGGCIVPDSACTPGQSSDFNAEERLLWILIEQWGRSRLTYEIRDDQPGIIVPIPGPPAPPQPVRLRFGPHDMIPLTFGVDESAETPNDPLLRVADLEGAWLVSRLELTDDFPSTGFEFPEPLPDLYTGASILRLGEREIERFEIADPAPDDLVAEVRHAVIDDPDQLFPPGTVLVCQFDFEHVFPDFRDPQFCGFRDPAGDVPIEETTNTVFRLISDNRALFFDISQQVVGGPIDLVRMEFFRLNYD